MSGALISFRKLQGDFAQRQEEVDIFGTRNLRVAVELCWSIPKYKNNSTNEETL